MGSRNQGISQLIRGEILTINTHTHTDGSIHRERHTHTVVSCPDGRPSQPRQGFQYHGERQAGPLRGHTAVGRHAERRV